MTPDQEALWYEIVSAHGDQTGYARYLCEQYLERFGEHAAVLLSYAICLTDLFLYDKAASALDRAETMVPKEHMHMVYSYRGRMHKQRGEFQAAEEQFLKAHALQPQDAAHLIYAASAAINRGDIKRAQELNEQATRCAEGSVDEAYFNLGGNHLIQQHYEEAMECYNRALEIDPDYAIAKKQLEDLKLILAMQSADRAGPIE